jgi:putative acetyltransferase
VPRSKPITLRAAELEDAPGVAALYRDRSVYAGTLQLPFPRESVWRERLERGDADTLNLLALDGDRVIGHGYLGRPSAHARRRHAGEVGLAVAEDHQGRGVGSMLMAAIVERADRWMQLTRLELEVYPDNAAALALYRKFGFVEEGRLRDYAFRDGVLSDVLIMARILR